METAGRVKHVTAEAQGRSRRLTCKSASTNPNDPLFLHDGLDDGDLRHVADHRTRDHPHRPSTPSQHQDREDPSATSVVLLRGIPGDGQHAGAGSRANV